MTLDECRLGQPGPQAGGRGSPALKLLLGEPEAKLPVALNSSCL